MKKYPQVIKLVPCLVLSLFLFACNDSKEIDWINQSIQELSLSTQYHGTSLTINNETGIDQIKIILAENTKINYSGKWNYFIDIKTEDQSTRWLYASHYGVLRGLGQIKSPSYKISNYFELNRLLNIPMESTVQILYYKTIDSEPSIDLTINDPETAEQLKKLYYKLPKKGDIFKKLASSSSKYEVIFYNTNDTETFQINIYNDSFQCEDTGFLADSKYEIEEKELIELVKKLIK